MTGRSPSWGMALLALAASGCGGDPVAAAATARPAATEAAPAFPSPTGPGPGTGTGTGTGTGAADPSAPPAETATATPPPPCPPDMAEVGRFCIDRHEAHLLLVGDDGSRALHPFNERPAEGARYVAANGAGTKPQGYISRVESEAACKAAGKRLCTRREWRAGCRGRSGSRWPYGHRGERGRCNSGKPHLLTVHFGDVRNIEYEEHFNSPLLNADPVGLAASGAYAGCTNEHGTFDMVGNLHEWVSGMVDADLVDELEGETVKRRDQPWQTGNGIFMGGFYSTTSEHGAGCDFTTIAHEPGYHDYSTGFRCCRDAVRPPAETDRTPQRRAPGDVGGAGPSTKAPAKSRIGPGAP